MSKNRVLLLAVSCAAVGAGIMRSLDTGSYVFGALVAILFAALCSKVGGSPERRSDAPLISSRFLF